MQQSVEPFLQLCQPLAAPGGDANHRNAQALFQPGQVDGDMPLFRLVQEVDTEQGFGTGLQHLHDQQQSTFQTGGITDHYRRIRFGKTEKVPCHSLFGTPGTERIGAGQIGKQNGLAAADSCADGAGYGFSCPVPGVLVQPGEGVEHGGLSHIGHSGKGNDRVFPLGQLRRQFGR